MRKISWLLMVMLMLVPMMAQAQENAETGATDVVTMRDGLPTSDSFQLVPIVNDLTRPLYVTHAGDDSGRLFIVEQTGYIKVYDPSAGTIGIFLDINAIITWDARGTGGYTERGLLGLAFHPNYAENGQFFINYTDVNGGTVVARYTVSADDPNVADPNSAEIIFTILQPFPNHNGGHMAFADDGYLYISIGDGGSANDPLAAGQNPNTLLGTIVRLDVDSEPQGDFGYAIPADNPFVDNGMGAPEVWAYGLRNAWRFSFDRATNDMYVGDVGQNQWEEINFQPAGEGGLNYGWNAFEASYVFNSSASAPEAVMPIAEYNHSEGCSVTGGYIYRGEAIPALTATYFYSDYCTGVLWGAYRDMAGNWQYGEIDRLNMQVSSFGEDQAGELYIVAYTGTVYQIVPQN
jgi:glucose/arabinose dehydrogenase